MAKGDTTKLLDEVGFSQFLLFMHCSYVQWGFYKAVHFLLSECMLPVVIIKVD